MNLTKSLAFSLVTIVLFSCQGSGYGPKYDITGFKKEAVGGGAQFASYYDAEDLPLAKGHVINGVRNGMWTTYFPNTRKIKTVTNYIHGKKNGIEMSLNDRGTVERMIEYKNDQLHGVSIIYKNNRPLSEIRYVDGLMDGMYKLYEESSGILQRSGTFWKGKEHGKQYYFDAKGNVTMEYLYKEGEKISGGIVNQASTN